MNLNLLKILEQLGYIIRYENSNLRIYDKNYKELRKVITNDEIYYGVDYIGDNNQRIHVDESGFFEIKVDDELLIKVDNLYDKYILYPITLFFGGDKTKYDYKISITLNNFYFNRNKYCYIVVEMGTNPALLKNGGEDSMYMYINIDEEGTVLIKNHCEQVDSYKLDECTKDKVLKTIVKFISDGSEYQEYEKSVQEGFKLIAPTLGILTDDLIKKHEEELNKRQGK